MSKHLSLSEINKLHQKEFGETKRVYLKNDFYCDVQQKFKPTSIQQLINDYQEILKQLEDYKDVAKSFIYVFYMLLLKHFTSIGGKIPNDVEKMTALCEKLIDLGILEELLNALPQEEVNKVNEMIHKLNKNTKLMENVIGELFLKAELSKDEGDAKI